MCGICGVFSKESVDSNDVKRMVKLLSHRGPDGYGIFTAKNVCLGHTRLAIIDLSNKGKQPMVSRNGEVVIVYNGEIFNYLEIRKELEAKGYKFDSGTDTEVVLNSYIEWGKECTNHFNGMWAFALYDERINHLWLSRDPFGIKPLYYTESEGKFYFASEIKALLPFKKAIANNRKLYLFFTGREGENEKETMFEGICKIPFSYTPKRISDPNGRFKESFGNAVRLRMRADVPIGTCLSGGLDSSSIVCTLLQNEQIDKMKSFSACYEDPVHDEREYIDAIRSDKLEKYYVFPECEKLIKDLSDIIYYQDEPFDSTSIFAQWCVMEEAQKQGVKVMLDGQGADEMFGGYTYYHKYTRPALVDMAKIKAIEHPKLHKLYKQIKYRDVRKHYSTTPYAKQFESKLTNRLYFDFTTTLPRLLKWEDRNSMAFGLEARPPFLDNNLVDLSFSLGDSLKISAGWTKCIVRKSMRGVLPDKVRLRRDKKGFSTPEEQWLMQMEDEVWASLENPFAEETIFRKGTVGRTLREFYKLEKKENMQKVWKLYCVEKWREAFFET